MGKGVADIIAEAEYYPDTPLIQSYAATVWLYGQTKEADHTALEYLKRAKALLKYANEREALFYSALECWYQRRLNDAASKLEALIKQWPRDLVALKVLEFIYYMMGQEHSGPRFLQTTESIYPPNEHSGYFLSSHSFALELCGEYNDARAASEQAIELEAMNPWAHHTLSHVFIKTGDLEQGTRLLEDYQDVWQHSGQAIHSHNNWHLALLYLESLDTQSAYSVLDSKILSDSPHMVIQQLDAISLLWRLEMAGHHVPHSDWARIADDVSENAKRCYTPFNSAHYIYALSRAARTHDLVSALDSIKSYVNETPCPEVEVWKSVGITLIEAASLMAEDNYERARDLFSEIINNVSIVGGSDAQNDLFRQAYLTSLINCGNKNKANDYMAKISSSPRPTPLQSYWRSLL